MKIVVISLDNLGYNKYIIKELETYSHIEVEHIDLNLLKYKYPNFSYRVANFFLKTLFDFNLKRNHLDKVILRKIEELGHQDKILIQRGDLLFSKTIYKLRAHTSKLIAFYNDNTKRFPRIKDIYPCFDVNYSFEKKDVEKYNFKFLTNYIYHEHLEKKLNINTKTEFEVFNISSLGKRNTIIKDIALVLDKINIPYAIFLVGKKGRKEKKQTNITYLTKKMGLEEVNTYINKSNILLDVQQEGQQGLTYRVLDSLAYSKKLITTNSDIATYDFYNPNNILIIDSKNIKIPASFFKNEYQEIPANIIEKYTLKHWVKTVFELF